VLKLIRIFDEAMAAENVDPAMRRRVINTLTYGNPLGDPDAVIIMETGRDA
jgi:hypothetical protein